MVSIINLNNELDELYNELNLVQSMSDEAVSFTFNADSKREYIDLLNEEIDKLEDELEEAERYRNREINYQRTEDKPYICW